MREKRYYKDMKGTQEKIYKVRENLLKQKKQ